MSAEVAICAAGMVSPLGPTIECGCAAALAGILRVADLPDFTGLDEGEVEPVPLKAHSITGLTDGFVGIGRLARLGLAALEDLDGRSGLGQRPERRIGMVLALPSRFFTASENGAGVDQKPWEMEEDNPVAEERARIGAQLFDLLAQGSGLVVQPTNRMAFFSDQSGVAEAIVQAGRWLAAGEIDDCVLGAVDSYCDPCILDDLYQLGLLKAPDQPHGFVPGEGGIMLHLVAPSDPAVSPPPRARLSAPVVHDGERHRLSDDPPIGDAIAKAVTDAIAGAGRTPHRLTSDLNGDLWRSQNWGGALTRIDSAVANLPTDYTGEAFGESGAAAGGFAIGLALHRAARWDATPIDTLIALQGYDGTASAFMVSTEPAEGGRDGW